MKMSLRKTAFSAISLILIVLAAFGWWLTMTSDGARWLVQNIAGMNAAKVDLKSVDGSLAKALVLAGLKIEWGNGEKLSIEKLSLRWNACNLLRRKVDIQELVIQGIHLALSEKGTSPGGKESRTRKPKAKPLAGYLPKWLHVAVNQLRLQDFFVTEQNEDLFHFKDLNLDFTANDAILTLRSFYWHSPYIHLKGKGKLQMETMSLEMEAEVHLPDELLKHEILASVAVPSTFPGRLKVQGSIFAYRGDLFLGDLDNQGIQLISQVTGNMDGLRLEKLYGHWLQGTVQGDLLLDWKDGFSMRGELFGRGLNPAVLDPQWPGEINIDVRGDLETPTQKPLQTEFAVTLHSSRLLSHSLAGTVEGVWDETDLVLKNLFLEGKGVMIKAGGVLAERLNFKFYVENLAHWLPESRGRLQAEGWLRWRDQYLALDARGEVTDLLFRNVSTSRSQFTARYTEQGGPLEFRFSARPFRYGLQLFRFVEIVATGTQKNHAIDLTLAAPGEAGLNASFRGSYRESAWRGSLLKFTVHGKDWGKWNLANPVKISAGKESLIFSPLALEGEEGSALRLRGEYRLQPREGFLEGTWHRLNLSRFGPWLPKGRIWGQSEGNAIIRWENGVPVFFTGRVRGGGGVAFGQQKIHLRRMTLDASWKQTGLEGSLLVDLGEMGELHVKAFSDQPIHTGEPRDCTFNIELQSLDLDILRRFFSGNIPLSGHLHARGKAQWLGGRRFSWHGLATVEKGELGWKKEEPVKGQVAAKIDKATFEWDWQKDSLHLDLVLVLETGGRLQVTGSLPLCTEFPLKIREQAPLQGKLTANMREWGLLTALLPDLMRETQGEIDADIALSGSWRAPLVNGELALKRMGGYLPLVGVQLNNVTFTTLFQGRKAKVTELRMDSGPGSVRGTGFLVFTPGERFNYRLELAGKDFQLANLPEIQILAEPHLLIQGDTQGFSLTGDILLSQLLVLGTQKTPPVKASEDVVIVRPEKEISAASSNFDTDIQVKITLGKNSYVRSSGLDAQLEGDVLILMKEAGKVLAQGQIRVARGNYTAYGANLHVKRGHINFTGGQVDNPGLDILALREVGKVRAGVHVGGTAESPEITLYSQPTMPDKDILGYIFLGRRIRMEQQESDLLAMGAGALLPQGPGFFRRLGFTDVDLGGLFTEERAVRLRYRLRNDLEVESTLGETSGVDIYHIIEFK